MLVDSYYAQNCAGIMYASLPLYLVYIYSLCECVMSAIRLLVVQDSCRRFEFARHFESHLARPPSFYMRLRTTIFDEHSVVTMLLSNVLYSQTIRLTS